MPLLNSLYNNWKNLPPVFVDGTICVLLAFCSGLVMMFGSDEAEKFIDAWILFWMKGLLSSLNSTLIALQFFRSKSYTDHLAKKEKQNNENNTQFITKS